MTMKFTNRRRRAYYSQDQEEQPSHFQPEHMQHPADVPQSDIAGVVESPNPAILAAFASSHTQ